jgi:uncharacterized membrane protein
VKKSRLPAHSVLGYSPPAVILSSVSPREAGRARWHFGLIFCSRGDSLRAMRPEPSGYLGVQNRRRHLGVAFAAALSLCLVLAFTTDAWARSSGGRYGGRAGFSQSRSGSSGSGSSGGGWSSSRPSPTSPYSAPTSPGYPPPSYAPPMSSPGFGFLPFLLPFLWGGWGGGGTRGGSGFGGILGLLIILGIVVLVGRVLLRNLASARRDRLDDSPTVSLSGERYAVVKCQLALLSTARSLQRELRNFANTVTTDTVAGLAAGLQDVVMALMRHGEYWRYGAVQVQHAATLDDTERTFNQVVSQERAKLSDELTVNIDGVRRQPEVQERAAAREVGQYLVVTLIVATGYPEFTALQTPSIKDLEATLQRLGTLLTSDVLAVEIMWSPENPDDTLTEDELITEYPELSGF